jgi:hypothetical protein
VALHDLGEGKNQEMNLRRFTIFAMALSALALAGCGGGSSAALSDSGNTVTVLFNNGRPTAVAAQIGAGSFATASLQATVLTLTLPQGVTKYAIAYACPPVNVFGTIKAEKVIEATLQDGRAYSVSCSAPPPTDHATGIVDASLIAGTASVSICGGGGCSVAFHGVIGSFDMMMPAGTNDVAVLALDASKNILAIKIIRGQTVPGVVNGGNTIVLAASDGTTAQPITVTNIPAGFDSPPAVAVEYFTGNGTGIFLNNNSTSTYRALPAAATQAGDFYSYESNTNDTATHNQAVGITQTTTSGGGPGSIALPAPWLFSGPTPAALPTFTFNYSGFAGLPATADQALIAWNTGPFTTNSITVTATASFQNGATTITMPNLSALPGFFGAPPSGTTINWAGDITGGTVQDFTFFPNPPANGSSSFAQNRGTYIEP